MTVPSGSPLNYPANAQPPLRRVAENRAPTVNDYKNFREGDEWLDKTSADWWKLADITQQTALWVKIGGTGAATEEYLPDSGTSPVTPNASNQLTVTGANGLSVVGSLNTLTFTTTNGEVATKFLPDTGTSPVVPDSAGEVTLAGGTGIITTGGLNTVTFDVDGSVITTQYDGDTGSATPTAGVLNIIGGNGTVSSASGNTVVVEMQSPFVGDFVFSDTDSGAVQSVTVSNNSNTASSDAKLIANVGGTSAGDPSILFAVQGTTDWSVGLDNDDADSFKISQSSAIGTNDVLASTVAGEVTKPLQPLFIARNQAAQNNVTGNGTTYTINFATEVVDIGSNYDGTNTFTAPVDGYYLLSVGARVTDLGAGATNGSQFITTSNRDYTTNAQNWGAIRTGLTSNSLDFTQMVIADMDAGDTAVFQIREDATGADTIDVPGTNINNFWFSGALLQ